MVNSISKTTVAIDIT
jgi:hypothetical protein